MRKLTVSLVGSHVLLSYTSTLKFILTKVLKQLQNVQDHEKMSDNCDNSNCCIDGKLLLIIWVFVRTYPIKNVIFLVKYFW